MSINEVLGNKKFRFNKQFGQNFISDDGLLESIVDASEIAPGTNVLEIGAGAGTLTRKLAERAGRVVAYEIDLNLSEIIGDNLAGYSNVEVRMRDFMKENEQDVADIFGGEPFAVVANIPYYITTPIIMKLLESKLNLESVTVMIQKEVAERLTAKPGTADYGVITVAVDLVGDATLKMVVDKTWFYPVPKVDSAVVRIGVRRDKYDVDYDGVMKTVKRAFAMRRKTLVNNLTAGTGLSREKAVQILCAMGLDERVRGERLSTEQFIALTDGISEAKC